LIVAERNKQAVGYAYIQYLWTKVSLLALLYVVEEHRRQGVGKAILAYLEAFLCERGHVTLYSSSQADEPPPQAWHRHVGFEECGFLAGLNDGAGEIFFRKRLC
jgi:GNAT superfamily N-acetyltransferase